MTRRYVGVGLLVAAVVLVIAVTVMWRAETADADQEAQAREFAEAISGQPFEDVEPNRTPAIALSATAAVLFLSGVIVLAVSPSPDS